MLFSDRSLLTMFHGVVLGGGGLMALAAALFALSVMRPATDGSEPATDNRTSALAVLTVAIALLLWMTVVTGTYIIFPPYRASPPAGMTELTQYPRSLLLSSPDTAWLHAFAMECKEHMPWIAAMLATAVAFVTVRFPRMLLTDPSMRRMAIALLAICFALASFTGLMGTLINKVAPLE
jgi:hypothetical protein